MPNWVTVENPTDNPMSIQLREPSVGRKLAGAGIAKPSYCPRSVRALGLILRRELRELPGEAGEGKWREGFRLSRHLLVLPKTLSLRKTQRVSKSKIAATLTSAWTATKSMMSFWLQQVA